ncbi:hypothetical protein [Gordonia terrae]|uniref:hypothetical protein n=1 Tax=Gordonia terrae TaxID=2055 RepID=UPI003F6CFC8F
MLTLALAATLIGFVLLILGLITGTVWLAVACIVVCLVGLGFLLVDVFSGRRAEAGRSIEDMVPGAGRDPYSSESDTEQASSPGGSDADEPTRRYPTQAVDAPTGGDNAPSGPRSRYDSPPFEPGMAAPERPEPSGRPAQERREGTLEDYLRSVGGDPSGDPTVVGPVRRDDSTQRFDPRQPGQQGAQHPGPVRPAPTRAAPSGPPRSDRPGPPPRQQWAPEERRPDFGRPDRGPVPNSGERSYESPPFPATPPRWASEEQRGGDTVEPADRIPSEGRGDASPRRPRDAGFDPLDPNWHPPPE